MKGSRIHQVGGNQAAIKKHSEKYVKCQRRFPRQLLQRQTIGQQGREHDVDKGTDSRNQYGNTVSPENLPFLIPDVGISRKAELFRQKGIAILNQRIFLRNG